MMQASAVSLAEIVEAVVNEHIERVGPLMLVLHDVQEGTRFSGELLALSSSR